MTPITYAARSSIIGALWSGTYLGLFRAFTLARWNFDPMRSDHWAYIWNLWLQGWDINTLYEWSFFVTFLAVLPVWLTGWSLLDEIEWGSKYQRFYRHCKFFFQGKQNHYVSSEQDLSVQTEDFSDEQNKSNKPVPLRSSITPMPQYDQKQQQATATAPASTPSVQQQPLMQQTVTPPVQAPAATPAPAVSSSSPSLNVPPAAAAVPLSTATSAAPSQDSSKSPALPKLGPPPAIVFDRILSRTGFTVLPDVTLGVHKIDFLGVSDNKLLLLQIDPSEGDWLADEERFNNEDPLWFSENDHRLSPVFKVGAARDELKKIISNIDKNMKVDAMVVMSQGNIINADDMKDTWKKHNVSVTRFAGGGPRRLKDITDVLAIDSEKKAPSELIDKIKKSLKK